MRKTTLLIISIIMLQSVLAQPSKETMDAKVKNEFDADLISHQLIGPGGIDREFENGVWVDYFTQPFEVVQKSEYPEYPVRYKASVRYINRGSAWLFHQFTVGSSSYLNVPPPDKNEALKLLNADIEKWIGADWGYAVGAIESIQFPADPDWYNKTPKEVAFYISAVFSAKISNTQLEKAEHLYRITLKRDNLKSPWKLLWGNEQTDKKKSLAKTTHSPEEIKQMKTMKQAVEENTAQNFVDALPTVADAPVFQSDKQLFYYLNEKILTSTPQEIEAHLMKIVDQSCYEDGSTVFFKPYHAEWINNLVANADKYKKAFCPYPGVKAEQYGQIEFLNRTLTNYVTMTGKPVDGTWKIVDFRFSPPSDVMLHQMEGNDTNCQPKPDLTVKEVIRYKVGDKVTVQFSNGTRPCTIDKTDPNMETRYSVKIDGDTSGRAYWIEDTFISKR
jgi:hypothetical protein